MLGKASDLRILLRFKENVLAMMRFVGEQVLLMMNLENHGSYLQDTTK